MNKTAIIEALQKQYPDKHIMCLPEDNPAEIICEIKPTIDNPHESIAIAIIEKSQPHFHKQSTETYEVIKGNLILHVSNQTVLLGQGEKYIIKPNEVHWAEGEETWIKTYSVPGWTSNDHILADS